MDRKRLNRHKSNKRELALIEKQLDRLYERLENVETVSGKVTKKEKSDIEECLKEMGNDIEYALAELDYC